MAFGSTGLEELVSLLMIAAFVWARRRWVD
jgi:hypothetical protein